MHTHTHTHTGTHTREHSDYTKFIHNLKQAANRDFRLMKTAAQNTRYNIKITTYGYEILKLQHMVIKYSIKTAEK